MNRTHPQLIPRGTLDRGTGRMLTLPKGVDTDVYALPPSPPGPVTAARPPGGGAWSGACCRRAPGAGRPVREADVAIVGAGAAGLSLARLLADPPPGAPRLETLLIETPRSHLRPPARTWCFWDDTPDALEAFTTASWARIRVYGPSGHLVESEISPLRYLMIRSGDYERQTGIRMAACRTTARLDATVTGIDDRPGEALVHCATPEGAAETVGARWVFDTRPQAPPPARTLLLQHFRGWFVRTERAAFDPGAAVLMDLRTEQPGHGLSFGYVLPFTSRTALVEYTEFSRRPLTEAQYERALHCYTARVLGLGRYRVVGTEQGVIPMTDGRFPRRTGASVFRLGAAGGATRPSTGYTFAAALRQVRAVGDALFAGRTPVPPPAHSARSRAMDAVMLRALDTGRVDGAEFFARLFARNDTRRLLRFLDGGTTPLEDLRIGATTPVLPMLRTVAELPWLRRRPAVSGP